MAGSKLFNTDTIGVIDSTPLSEFSDNDNVFLKLMTVYSKQIEIYIVYNIHDNS